MLVAGVLGYYLLSNADSAPGDSGLVYFIWGIGLLLFTVVQLPVMLPVCFLMATAGLGAARSKTPQEVKEMEISG